MPRLVDHCLQSSHRESDEDKSAILQARQTTPHLEIGFKVINGFRGGGEGG